VFVGDEHRVEIIGAFVVLLDIVDGTLRTHDPAHVEATNVFSLPLLLVWDMRIRRTQDLHGPQGDAADTEG